jgi:hypothetical protein
MEAMSSSGSGQTFEHFHVNKPANTTSFRFGMERMNGWNPNHAFEATLQNNASNYNYYVVS